MKKLSLSSFEEDVLKSDISKKITGGYYGNEGTATDTCHANNTISLYGPTMPDYHSDGDWYSSC
ncbi:hypothetical protein [Flagellimonas meridianipacifica]|uniref:Uncharacterized protein n=1 Tax=Flagellimonas meridianipacifica TaxID=1080225 RepID=A0A2T0MCN9_9FLAO|nr:hypothetical protein [Allomuricauda pacifica]PRX55258.1 hypothetical protein CLV81_3667 [Allomuricauda pacifica]